MKLPLTLSIATALCLALPGDAVLDAMTDEQIPKGIARL